MPHRGVQIIRESRKTSRLRFCDSVCYTEYAGELAEGRDFEGFDLIAASNGCCSNCGATVFSKTVRKATPSPYALIVHDDERTTYYATSASAVEKLSLLFESIGMPTSVGTVQGVIEL